MRKLIHITFLALGLSSCWPTSVSFRENSMPEEWKAFYVSPLELTTSTPPPSYNGQLSESLRSGIQNNTRLKLGRDLESSQVQINGTVSNYNTSPIALQQGDNAAQNRLTITVNFVIVTPTQGLEKIQVSSTRFADYDANQNLSDVETQLLETINQQITQDVINKLLSNW